MLRLKWLVVLPVLCALIPCRGETPPDRPIIWGVMGHPAWSDYAEWEPANVVKFFGYVHQLGCTYFRSTFAKASYPAELRTLVPIAQADGITLLPDLPIKIVAKEDARTNYMTNYKIGSAWAAYAISNNYNLPYWELGNELEGWSLVKIIGDGSSPNDFPDKTPGGFVAIASSLSGAYHGIKDTYAKARTHGETTIVPQMLYGATYRHWGLLTKIQQYNGSLPFDIISWHWYEPDCGLFSSPIHDKNSSSNNRTPSECLADFKNQAHPDQPMDVWITELNRSVHHANSYDNGSVSNNTAEGKDWAVEANQIKAIIEDLKKAPTVKAMFVYELFDETKMDSRDAHILRDQGYFGLMTGLDGQYKDAFYTYQNEIKGNP